METFTPSLDWGNEILTSALWVARAWAISAICILIVLTLIARFTTWGRQFWRVTGDYFKGPESVLVWAWLGVLLLSVMVSVRIDVLWSYQGNDQFSALQTAFSGAGAGNEAVRNSGIRGFWTAMVTVRHPGRHQYRPHAVGSLPPAALHHALAGLAHQSTHR